MFDTLGNVICKIKLRLLTLGFISKLSKFYINLIRQKLTITFKECMEFGLVAELCGVYIDCSLLFVWNIYLSSSINIGTWCRTGWKSAKNSRFQNAGKSDLWFCAFLFFFQACKVGKQRLLGAPCHPHSRAHWVSGAQFANNRCRTNIVLVTMWNWKIFELNSL